MGRQKQSDLGNSGWETDLSRKSTGDSGDHPTGFGREIQSMNGDNSVAIAEFQRKQVERLDDEVPQILQQVDAKILLNYLKGNPNGAQVNIINIGRIQGSPNSLATEDSQRLAELHGENEELKLKLKEARNFGLLEWLEGLPQPRHEYMIREVVLALKERFDTQKEACDFIGVTPRVFSYWMKSYSIPGYKPRKYRRRKEE